MKKVLSLRAVVIASCFFLAACVPSVNPLYTADTIVFDEALLGIWKDKPEADDSWNFSRSNDKSYTLVIQEKDANSKFSAHLVKLGDVMFLDLFPDSAWTGSVPNNVLEKAKIGGVFQMALIPGHLIMKVK